MPTRGHLPFLTLVWYLGLVALLPPSAPPSQSVPHPPLPTPAEVALAFLASSDAFYSGAVGYAGTPSPQAFAWNTLLQLPRADTLFATLLTTGNRPGPRHLGEKNKRLKKLLNMLLYNT